MSSHTTRSVYLDHAATTPMRAEAIAAMTEELGRLGNPSSLHAPAGGPAGWWRSPGSSWPRCSGPGPARWSSPAAGPKRTTWPSRGSTGRARTATRAGPGTDHLGGAPRGAGLGRWLEETQGAEAVWLAVDATARSGPRYCGPLIDRPRPGRPGQRHVGQQRGRHGAAGHRAGRGGARVRHAVPHRRGAGRRASCRSTSPPAGRTR